MARNARPARIPHGILSVYAVAVGPRTWRSCKLAVDTGATYTMLPPDLLMDIGHAPTNAVRQLELSTANGLVLVPLLRIRALKCLGLTLRGVDIVAHYLPTESPVEGLLGLDVLSHFAPFQRLHEALRPFTA